MKMFRVIAMLAALVLLAACGESAPSEAPAGDATATETGADESEAPRELETVSLAMTNLSITYLSEHISLIKGFWEEEGLEVRVSQLGSSTAIPAVASGAVDYGDSTGSTLKAAAQGIPIVLVACGGVKPLYSLISQPEFPDVESLRGKAIGVNQLGNEGSYQTTRRLLEEEFGENPDDFTWMAVGSSSARVNALEAGEVGAAVIPPPHSESLVEKGYHRHFGPDKLDPDCNQGINTSREKLENDPDQVERMLRGYAKGLKYMIDNKEESIEILAEWLAIEPDLAKASYELAVEGGAFSYTGGISDEELFQPVAAGIADGEVESSVSIDDVRDFTLWNQVIEEMKSQ